MKFRCRGILNSIDLTHPGDVLLFLGVWSPDSDTCPARCLAGRWSSTDLASWWKNWRPWWDLERLGGLSSLRVKKRVVITAIQHNFAFKGSEFCLQRLRWSHLDMVFPSRRDSRPLHLCPHPRCHGWISISISLPQEFCLTVSCSLLETVWNSQRESRLMNAVLQS